MIFLRLLPILCALLFILTRRIDVKVTKQEDVTVKISFNILAIVLSEDKIKKRSIRKISKLMKYRSGILRATDYILSKSSVALYKSNATDKSARSLPVLYNASMGATVYFLISYLEKSSKSFKFQESQGYNNSGHPSLEFNLFLHFSLWHLIISALLFLYYIVKNRVKRVLNNV